MKKLYLLIFVMLFATGMALAQNPGEPLCSATITTNCITPPAPGTLPTGLSSATYNVGLARDVLGAHNGYGRGCVMCHAPHGGAQGNNAPAGVGGTFPNTTIKNGSATAASDTANGSIALWGENLAPYYGATVSFIAGTVILPASASDTSQGSGAQTVLLCLSCHDGALTKPAMMAGTTVEALPVVGGSAPTLFGTTAGNSALKYINEHPVGVSVSCNNATTSSESGHNWDCTGGGAGGSNPIVPSAGTNMTAFLNNYPASFWNGSSYPLATFGTSTGGTGTNAYTTNGVTCTTCHNQHSMTVYTNTKGSYPTMFFINGEYMPSTGGNSVAQFCRNCHGGESNEMAGLTSVPTT